MPGAGCKPYFPVRCWWRGHAAPVRGSRGGAQAQALAEVAGADPEALRPRAQVVEENKRQLCVFQEAVHKQEPWLWWAFAADYAAQCTMANRRFNDRACARQQAEAAGLDFAAIETCMANSSKDEAHPLLEARSP